MTASEQGLDALTAAGFAVVELPKPRYRGRRALIARPKVYDFGVGGTQVFPRKLHVSEPYEIVCETSTSTYVWSPEQARQLAASLLAAAAYAEVARGE